MNWGDSMNELKHGSAEEIFAGIIWDNEPLTSNELSKLSEQVLGWRKTTSFTVLKRLCNKGIFQNNKGTVTSLISRQDYISSQSEQFVEHTFNGSLPAFLAAFTSRKKLSAEEIAEIRRMIDEYEEGII